MNKIKVLPDQVANMIAAGEVVERPASVVKELVENAVDAGATMVHVEVERGGTRLIRVADNGSGMGRDDALLSLDRHATSKIATAEDIQQIITLGFRGEALPSIAAVSKLVIETRTPDRDLGTRVTVDGGTLRNVTDCGRDPGTMVEVRNLFFNLPARRKFLRTDATELSHVKTVLYEASVAAPGIGFTLVSEGRELYTSPRSDDRSGVLPHIFGVRSSGSMLRLSAVVDDVDAEGWFALPENATTGYSQYIVVNGRPVRSRAIVRAVAQAYGPALARGMSPAFVLYLEVDPRRVDVNIHPSKREIRIHREFALLQGLTGEIAGILGNRSAMPRYELPHIPGEAPHRTPVTVYSPPADRWYADTPSVPAGHGSGTVPHQTEIAFTGEATVSPAMVPTGDAAPQGAMARFEGPRFLQLDNRYIVTTLREGAIIVDQHVAHERILCEEILGNFRGRPAAAQQLLFPVTVDFSAAEYDVLEPMLPHLGRVGFGIRSFGERSVMIDAVPAGMEGCEDGAILFEFIEEMRVHGRITSGYLDKLAAALACRAALKSGRPLEQHEMQNLIDRLFATGAPFVCPHGRPTMVKLTLDELNRRFGR